MNIDGKGNATSQERDPLDLDYVLQAMEKNLPEGSVRVVTPVIRDESGEVVLSVATWKIPDGNEASGD